MEENKILSIYEEDFRENIEKKENAIQIVIFRISNEWYGVDILKVKEILKVGKLTYLPSSPQHIIGIINLRGNIFSVTDLKIIMELRQEEITDKSRLIFVEENCLETAILVDEVNNISEVAISKIEPAMSTIPSEKSQYMDGECLIDNRLVGILNIKKILEI